MSKSKFFFFILCGLFTTNLVHATYAFSPSISYLDHTQTDNTNPKQSAKLTLIDLRFGYILDFGLYLGGLYSLQDYDLLAESSDSFLGPSVGYYYKGLFAVLTYYVYGERDLSQGDIKYTNAVGFQLDLSYSVPVAENILVGPQLTFHNIEFKEAERSGISETTNYKFGGISPYFNVTFLFE